LDFADGPDHDADTGISKTNVYHYEIEAILGILLIILEVLDEFLRTF